MKGWTIVIDKDSLIAVPMYIDTDKTNYYEGTDKEIDYIDNYEIYEMVHPFFDEEFMAKYAEIANDRFLDYRAKAESVYRLDHHGEYPNFDMKSLRYMFFEVIRAMIGCDTETANKNCEKLYSNTKSND